MRTEDFDYVLPSEFIAQTPAEPRDSSRLMVLERESDRVRHDFFYNIGKYLMCCRRNSLLKRRQNLGIARA